MAKFSINEVVVYSGQGVGVVQEIVQKTIANETLDYYVIYLSDSDMTVLVPISRSKELGVRSIITKKEAKEAIEFLKEVNEPIIMDWKARYQKNMQLFKSGDIKNTAIVVKSLYRRSKVKELPIQERKLYESAYNVFLDEIVAVLKLEKREIEEMIHSAIEPIDGEEIIETIRKKELKDEYEDYEEDEIIDED